MEAPAQTSLPKPWPPEGGARLFWAWMGAILAYSVLSQIMFAATGGAYPPKGFDRVLIGIPVVALFGWQASLILRGYPARIALWIALPVLQMALPATTVTVGAFLLATPLVEAGLMTGIRRRPWAWIFAGMFAAALQSVGTWVYYTHFYSQFEQTLATLGTPAWLSMLLRFSPSRGMWLGAELVAAAVLAWTMPPVHPRASESAS